MNGYLEASGYLGADTAPAGYEVLLIPRQGVQDSTITAIVEKHGLVFGGTFGAIRSYRMKPGEDHIALKKALLETNQFASVDIVGLSKATGGGMTNTTEPPRTTTGQPKIGPIRLISICALACPVVGLMKGGVKGLLIGSVVPVGLFLWAARGYNS